MRRTGPRSAGWGPGSGTVAGIRQLHLLVALVAPALMFATIWFMAAQQNAGARQAETMRAASVERYLLDRIALLGADNANWDDAYRHGSQPTRRGSTARGGRTPTAPSTFTTPM